MAASIDETFNTWLSKKLFEINKDVDLDVFVSYITGILETEISEDDRNESLSGILSEIVMNGDDGIEEYCIEIARKWSELCSFEGENSDISCKESMSIDATIHNIITQQNAQSAKVKAVHSQSSDHQKAAILAQYANVSDGDGESDEELEEKETKPTGSQTKDKDVTKPGSQASNEDLLVKNMNALLVKERERVERDRAKQESDQKRLKDKEDREKQKQKSTDRKDVEKKRTQKGERKR